PRPAVTGLAITLLLIEPHAFGIVLCMGASQQKRESDHCRPDQRATYHTEPRSDCGELECEYCTKRRVAPGSTTRAHRDRTEGARDRLVITAARDAQPHVVPRA